MFIDAMQTDDTTTENGMPAHTTSGHYVLDFFSKSGALRADKKLKDGLKMFKAAFSEDPLLATKALFYSRDVRGGQGERQLFRDIINWLAHNHPHVIVKNIGQIPEFGRWDDLKALTNTPVQTPAIQMWTEAIEGGNGLAAKWLPRKGPWFAWTKNASGMKCGSWRRKVASLTSVVESQMCRNEWGEINYSHVPSVANTKYLKAFHRRDGERYRQFLQKAVKGEVKINSSTLYPSDLVKMVLPSYYGDAINNSTADALWKQLPDWISGSNQQILAVCDVSGSMNGEPLQVSIALGLYVSERLQGPFKDVICTFSDNPEFVRITGNTLSDRVSNLARVAWNMSTNLEAVFGLMLGRALKNNLPADQMPTTILIISDMQFNQCVSEPSASAMKMIRKKYAEARYEIPKVVFWNVRASKGQPAKHNDKGVALVSGYSPSIMKSILDMKPMATPTDLMLETLNAPRYEAITI